MTTVRQQRTAVVAALRQGQVAIFPTESSYAIGCRCDSRTGIRQIMQRKGRRDPRFTLMAASLTQVQDFFRLNHDQLKFSKTYWPGAVSLVVTARFAVRVPASVRLRRLAQLAGAPIIASSLNRTGQPAVFNLARLPKIFQDLPQLNIGKLAKKPPSTVVVILRHRLVVLRPGSVKL